MSAPTPEELGEAARWLGGAEDELVAARVLAGHPEAPGRAACFHAHLAAEKALKALLIVTVVRGAFPAGTAGEEHGEEE